MTNESKTNTGIVADDEIDLIALAKTIWTGRRLLITTILIFMAIGLAVALFSPKQYTASTTMVPHYSRNQSKLGGLSSLAAIAGYNIEMNMETGELSPYVYPQIVESVPFQLELMETPFKFDGIDKPISVYQFYTEHSKPNIISLVKKYTIGLPSVIISTLKPKKSENLIAVSGDSLFYSAIALTAEQENIRNIIEGQVTLELNDKEGYVVLNVVTHDPWVAAQLAQKAQDLMQKYITEFKIKKAIAQLKFIQDRHAEKKKEFQQAQTELAAFIDRNKNVTSAVARTEEQRLQNEYKLAFDVYSNLSQQLEQAQIKVKEDTPIFSILKPVTVPLQKSKPNRPLIVAIWTFLGGVIGVGWIFGKQFFADVKTKWAEEPEV